MSARGLGLYGHDVDDDRADDCDAQGAAELKDGLDQPGRLTRRCGADRERDIVTLVTSGMSYAQIARQLFITQSTVSYHLGNIHAKANVGWRHQLTALARADPTALGLTLPA
jgi:DNA-binding CsgD family transcriptional regulator